jgi:hypothetical protein
MKMETVYPNLADEAEAALRGKFVAVCTQIKNSQKEGRAWWLTPVIPAQCEAEMGGSQFEASTGKKLARPHLKK